MVKETEIIFNKVNLAEIIIENTKEPNVTAIFKLYNSKKNCISDIRLSNKYYYNEENKFKMSNELNEKIKEIMKIFEYNFIESGHLQEVCN